MKHPVFIRFNKRISNAFHHHLFYIKRHRTIQQLFSFRNILTWINKVLIFTNEKLLFNTSLILDTNSTSQNPTSADNMIDIDEKLKSLEKFIKQNFPR